jgi:hypothetical protein
MTKRNKPLTDVERERIKFLSAAGMPQRAVAAELRLHRDSVRKIQALENLRPYLGFVLSAQQKKTIRSLWKRHGSPRISRATGIPKHVVEKFMRQEGHKKPFGAIGFKRHLTVEELRDLRREIRRNEAAIAKQFGVSHAWLRRFRLRMWNNSGEQSWKRKRRAMNEFDYIKLVQHVTGGKLPDHSGFDARLVAAMVHCLVPENVPVEYRNRLTPAAWEKVRDSFAAHLAEAIGTCRAAQESPWTN